MPKGKKKKAKYTSNPASVMLNKKAKQERHIKKLEKILKKAMERDKLLISAIAVLNINKSSLRRLMGTLNTRRLRAVIDNKYLNSQWFISRELRRRKMKHENKHPYKRTTEKDTQDQHGIPEGGNTPDGNPQVDRERESTL